MTIDRQIVLRFWQWLTRSDQQLPLNQIHTSNGFADRMFNLQARVHLHEIKIHRAFALLHNKLNRASADIINRTRRLNCSRTHRFTHGRIDTRCWRFFQYFLMATLHGAIPLKQMHIIAMRITEYLDFDMAWFERIFFDQHLIIAKTGNCFTAARVKQVNKITALLNDTHAFAAAACTRFD